MKSSLFKITFKSSRRLYAAAVKSPNEIKWEKLSKQEQLVYEKLGWNESNWNGKSPPPKLSEWKELSNEQKAIVQHGLSTSESQWNNYVTSRSLTVSPATKDISTSSSSSSLSTLSSAVWSGVKFLAPVIAPMFSNIQHTRHSNGMTVAAQLAATLFEQAPSLVDQFSDKIAINNLETILYLDDSSSMSDKLDQGKNVLSRMSNLLQKNSRIVKFGSSKTILSPRDNSWSEMSVSLGWDATSGGTYMWKMILDDVLERYIPGIVIVHIYLHSL